MSDEQPTEKNFGEIMWLGDFVKVEFKPDDVGVLKVPGRLSQEGHARIKAMWEKVMGGRKLLIFDSGLELGVLSLQDKSDV